MEFQFPVTITEEDFCLFNDYVLLHTEYYKHHRRRARIRTTVIFAVATVWMFFISRGWWGLFLFFSNLLWLYALIWNLRLNSIMKKSMRRRLRRMKKSGILPYIPECTMEFHGDCLVEQTPTSRTERSYSSIVQAVLVEGQCLYMFLDQQRAYLLPCRCVGDQLEALVAFLEEKGITVHREKRV